MALFDQPGMIGPYTNPNVDFNTETVEGRIKGLTNTDGIGNYTNPVVQQAVARQDQAFNARGLRNSSIAVQGGTEAAISKAIDIAAPDANKYFENRRSNVNLEADFTKQKDAQGFDMAKQDDAQAHDLHKMDLQWGIDRQKTVDTQSFQIRQDYQKAVQTIGTNFQRQLDTINASSMTPADKNIAVQQAAAMRDGEIAFQNTLYSKMPQWQNEWLASAVPTAGMDINSIGNQDTLANIANDPAQPQANRDAAMARLAAGVPAAGSSMIGGSGGAPSAGTTPSGTQLPVSGSTGFPMNWNTRSSTLGGQAPAQAYATYEQQGSYPGGVKMTPEQWYQWYFPYVSWGDGGGDGGDGGAGAAAGAAASGGDSGGVSI